MMRETLYFVLCGPSGVGKSTIIKKMAEILPDLGCPVSHTSRPPRADEIEGVDYYFRRPEVMTKMKIYDEFAELSTCEDGTHYGLTKAEIRRMRRFQSALVDLDVSGGRAMKELLGDAVILIMVAPADGDDLEARLKSRGSETPQEINKRLVRAVVELSASDEFDYLVVNRTVEEAAAQVQAIIQAEHLRMKRAYNGELIQAVLNDLYCEI